MKQSEIQSREYDVFLSYRHLELDKAVACRLEYLLENAKHPLFREKLGKEHLNVFRDEDELPIDSDLSQSLEQALLASR